MNARQIIRMVYNRDKQSLKADLGDMIQDEETLQDVVDAIEKLQADQETLQDVINDIIGELGGGEGETLAGLHTELDGIKANQTNGEQLVQQSGSNVVVDDDGNIIEEDIPISAVKDDDGNYVLKFVDSAPHAYDEENDVFMVKSIEDETKIDEIVDITNFEIDGNDDEYIFGDGSGEGKDISKFCSLIININDFEQHDDWYLQLEYGDEGFVARRFRETFDRVDMDMHDGKAEDRWTCLQIDKIKHPKLSIRLYNESSDSIEFGRISIVGIK